MFHFICIPLGPLIWVWERSEKQPINYEWPYYLVCLGKIWETTNQLWMALLPCFFNNIKLQPNKLQLKITCLHISVHFGGGVIIIYEKGGWRFGEMRLCDFYHLLPIGRTRISFTPHWTCTISFTHYSSANPLPEILTTPLVVWCPFVFLIGDNPVPVFLICDFIFMRYIPVTI